MMILIVVSGCNEANVNNRANQLNITNVTSEETSSLKHRKCRYEIVRLEFFKKDIIPRSKKYTFID
jgi:hypothetical protein